jgi:dTDP-4-dehydrorhamnose 3,5-epimerase
MRIETIKLDKKQDRRGWFLKILMNRHITGKKEFGELYLSVVNAGEVRGEHCHKETTEWFCTLKGKGLLNLLDTQTGEKQQMPLDEDAPLTIVVPPGIAHSIQNMGHEPLYLLAYSDVEYDAGKPDTFPMKV